MPLYFSERYQDVKKVLVHTFFGPPKEGVDSPSVQATLYQMARDVLDRSLSLLHTWKCPLCECCCVDLTCFGFLWGLRRKFILDYHVFRFPDVSSIHMKMPNLHFQPVNLSSKDNIIVKVGFILPVLII